MGPELTAVVTPAALAVVFAVVAAWSRRRGRRVTAGLFGSAGLLAVLSAVLIAARGLPGPLLVGLLLAALAAVGLVAVWPLPARVRRSRAGWRR